MIFDNLFDWFAFAWFLTCWIGYTAYARNKAKKTDSLSAVLYRYRVEWMKDLMRRENRVPDLILLGNLVQMVNFLATTTIFVLAGAITILYSSENVLDLLNDHAFVAKTNKEEVQFKVLVLVLIFVFAFFRFTWAMRQHSFCSIMIGAAPHVTREELTDDETNFALQIAKISDRASHEFNYGLRSYYFALSLLAWFINPYALAISATIVVWVLYLREFKSKTLFFMKNSRENFTRMKALKSGAITSHLT